jgi:putative hemolysin
LKLIDLSKSFKNPFLKHCAPALEKLLSVDAVNRYYQRASRMDSDQNFFDRVLRAADVNYFISAEDRDLIPREGPLIVVSNHPHGAADGLALGSLLVSVRNDVKFLVNYLLSQIVELNPYFIHVDPFGGHDATKANIGPLKETLKFLKAGGCIGTFPSPGAPRQRSCPSISRAEIATCFKSPACCIRSCVRHC